MLAPEYPMVATVLVPITVHGEVAVESAGNTSQKSLGSAGSAVPAKTHKSLTRSEEHTSELQSLMRISYAVFCLTKKQTNKHPYIMQNRDTDNDKKHNTQTQ